MADGGDNDNEKQEPGAERPVVLDEHRGLTAQKEINERRLETNVRADLDELKKSRASLEKHLFAKPAATWRDAAEKCRYILGVFATTGEAQDPRYKQLIAEALADLERLQRDDSTPVL